MVRVNVKNNLCFQSPISRMKTKQRKRKRSSSRIIHVKVRSTPNSQRTTISTDHSRKSIILTPQSQINQNQHKTILSDNSDQQSRYKTTKVKDEWPDWTTLETEHHPQIKKTKTYRHKCVIASILVCSVLILITAIILIALLTKPVKPSREAFLRWNTTGITVAGVTGPPGNGLNQLHLPSGLEFDYSHALYIGDSGNNRVQRYSRDGSSIKTVCGQANRSSGSDAFHLYGARKIALDSNRNIYVSDVYNNRVQFWAAGASSGITVAGQGGGGNNLYYCQGIRLDLNANVFYLADTSNDRVLRYFIGSPNGTVVAGGYGQGTNQNQLNQPTGIIYDAIIDSLIIANYGTSSILKWKLGDSEWTRIAGNIYMIAGNSSTDLFHPEGVDQDVLGNIYVPDSANHRIQFFPLGQSVGQTIAGITGVSGSNATLFNYPMELELDNQLNLYVSDGYNNRVQKFSRY